MVKHKKDVTAGIKGRVFAQMGQPVTTQTPLIASSETSPPLVESKLVLQTGIVSPSSSSNASAAHLFVRSPVKKMLIAQLRIDNSLQSRVKINTAVVVEYSESLDRGDQFPPVVAYFDGADYWVADGFHRLEAHRITERVEIAVEVRQGTRQDALLFAVGPANGQHGLRRSTADKRRSIELVLAEPLWSSKSDRWVADVCFVTDKTVAAVRRNLQQKSPTKKTETPILREGRDGKMRQQPVRKPLTAEQIPEVVAPAVVVQDRDTTYRANPGGSLSDIGLHDSLQRVVGVPIAPPAVKGSPVTTVVQRQVHAAIATTVDSLDYLATSLPEETQSSELRAWIHQGRILLDIYSNKE